MSLLENPLFMTLNLITTHFIIYRKYRRCRNSGGTRSRKRDFSKSWRSQWRQSAYKLHKIHKNKTFFRNKLIMSIFLKLQIHIKRNVWIKCEKYDCVLMIAKSPQTFITYLAEATFGEIGSAVFQKNYFFDFTFPSITPKKMRFQVRHLGMIYFIYALSTHGINLNCRKCVGTESICLSCYTFCT